MKILKTFIVFVPYKRATAQGVRIKNVQAIYGQSSLAAISSMTPTIEETHNFNGRHLARKYVWHETAINISNNTFMWGLGY